MNSIYTNKIIIFVYTYLHTSAPTRPPQNLIGTSPTPSTLSLSWSPPPTDEQNGVIRSYKITVVNQETGSSLTYSTTGTSYFLGELHPHYSYNYSVAAHTVETGPTSSIIVQQPEDSKYCTTFSELVSLFQAYL